MRDILAGSNVWMALVLASCVGTVNTNSKTGAELSPGDGDGSTQSGDGDRGGDGDRSGDGDTGSPTVDGGNGQPGKPVVPPDGGPLGMLTGQSGIWENATPAGISLEVGGFSSDNYGVLDVLADPAHPGTFYAFVCYQGVWKSTDFGGTWNKVSTDNNLERGRPWGEAIAPDSSYMLACTGYSGRHGVWKSTDDGATWKSYPIGGDDDGDPYMFEIDPTNVQHVIATSHSVGSIYESTDGGETWVDKGDGGVGHSGYVFFITSTTWLLIAQDDHGTRRTTNSGASWTDVGPMRHAHGTEQIYIDPDTRHIYVPSHGGNDPDGIYLSTDDGVTFTRVSTAKSVSIFATDDTLYSLDSYAVTGSIPPNAMRAMRSMGTQWSSMSTPPAMFNGPKRAAVAFDAESDRWVIVSGNWNAGIWRYIEE